MNYIRYRPDIDGLRAIAILSVIGYHSFPDVIRGGFVGVDIFFVISGFLISSIVFQNLEKNNFSYFEFYSRRIRRIFPALILVLITSWLLGWYVLFPDEYSQLGKHIAGGIGFISNFILVNEAGYFDRSSEAKPLLHLWSLGIEEQFYIFWPILLGLVWRYRLKFLSTTILVAVTSFLVNIIYSIPFSTTPAFYLPFNRFWELMIGGVLAYIALHKDGWQSKKKMCVNCQSMLGVSLIVTATFLIDRDKAYPGWWALLPTTGAFFLISAQGSWVNSYILSHRAPVYIGLISYPLYLWHVVLLSFSHILEYASREAKLVSVGLSFILAWLTYEFIEKRIKRRRGDNVVYVLIGLASVVLLLGLGTFVGLVSPRNNSPGMALAAAAVGDWEYPRGLAYSKVNDVDVFVKNGANEKVLFFGDSHMEQYAPRIVKLIDENPINTKTAIFATRGGCPPIPNVYEDKHPLCNAKFKETIIEYALSSNVNSVVLAANWSYLIKNKKPPVGGYRYYYLLGDEKKYFDEDGISFALRDLEAFLSAVSRNKKVFLVIGNPSGREFDPKSFFVGSRVEGFTDHTVYYREYDKRQSDLRTLMIKLANRANATVIDAVEHFCNENRCRTVLNDGTPIYKDAGHIRPFYVKQYVEFMDVTVKK